MTTLTTCVDAAYGHVNPLRAVAESDEQAVLDVHALDEADAAVCRAERVLDVAVKLRACVARLGVVEANAERLRDGDPLPCEQQSLDRVFQCVTNGLTVYGELYRAAPDRDGPAGVSPDDAVKFDALVAYAESAFAAALWAAQEQVRAGLCGFLVAEVLFVHARVCGCGGQAADLEEERRRREAEEEAERRRRAEQDALERRRQQEAATARAARLASLRSLRQRLEACRAAIGAFDAELMAVLAAAVQDATGTIPPQTDPEDIADTELLPIATAVEVCERLVSASKQVSAELKALSAVTQGVADLGQSLAEFVDPAQRDAATAALATAVALWLSTHAVVRGDAERPGKDPLTTEEVDAIRAAVERATKSWKGAQAAAAALVRGGCLRLCN